jgi:hypothetical protein
MSWVLQKLTFAVLWNEYNYQTLDIILRRETYLKHNVSEAGFYLRFQVAPTQFGPVYRSTICLGFGSRSLRITGLNPNEVIYILIH